MKYNDSLLYVLRIVVCKEDDTWQILDVVTQVKFRVDYSYAKILKWTECTAEPTLMPRM